MQQNKTQTYRRHRGPNPDYILRDSSVKSYFQRPQAVPCDHLILMWPKDNHRIKPCHDALQQVLPGLKTLVMKATDLNSCHVLKILKKKMPQDQKSLMITLMVPRIVGYTREIISSGMLNMPTNFSEEIWSGFDPDFCTPSLLMVRHPRALDALDVVKRLYYPPRIFLQTKNKSQISEII